MQIEQTIENFSGTKSITVNEGGNKSDVEAGIEFIYNMREHIVDVAVATLFGLVVYASVMYIKKKFS